MRWGSTTPGATTACGIRAGDDEVEEGVHRQGLLADRHQGLSPYITKIRQSGADALFMVLQGDENNAFLSQAQHYRLPDKVQLLTEIVDLASIRAVGDASSAW